ncbi:hypothetical protein PHYPO_G00133230 [Pangasianodon hypophthalmus]|uniref:Uncharacterized protein n=1 Tax=Pangasianodon hypophthalmus TaxID=310915 RepID=A0A5N5KK75_PANHP|nr:hypothetical protein PHYPO_G00133230 [Pangasianodon hypophthalmus]
MSVSACVTSPEQRSVTSSDFPSKRAEMHIWQSSSNMYCAYDWLMKNKIDSRSSQLQSASTSERQPFLSPVDETQRLVCVLNRPFAGIWQKRPLFFLTLVSPLLFKNSAEKEETIFQNLQAVISRLPSFCTADSGRNPSPSLSILLHINRTQGSVHSL